MNFTIEVMGMKEAQDDLNDLIGNVRGSIARVANFIAASTAARAKNLIREAGRSGRVYTLSGGRQHQASAPGEPPANVTGALARSITHTRMTDRDGSVARIGATMKKAKTLELGGFVKTSPKFGSRTVYIEPRPFLFPSFIAAVNASKTKLKTEFEKGL